MDEEKKVSTKRSTKNGAGTLKKVKNDNKSINEKKSDTKRKSVVKKNASSSHLSSKKEDKSLRKNVKKSESEKIDSDFERKLLKNDILNDDYNKSIDDNFSVNSFSKENDSVKEDKLNKESDFSKKSGIKGSFTTFEVIIVMLITVMFGLLIGGFIVFNKYGNNGKECTLNDDLSEFNKVYNDIIDNYYGEVDKKTLVNAAIEGMVNELDDPNSYYLDKKSNTECQENLEGTFVCIGVELYQSAGDYPVISSVFEDSPAEKAGIMPGDKILKARGVDFTGMVLDSVVSTIKNGKVGEKFNITVDREGKEMEIDITLGNVALPSVYVTYISKGDSKVAVVRITTFALNTYSQFKKAYNEIKDSGAVGMVIDVRGNVGGYLSSAYSIASMFVDRDVVVYEEDTKGSVEKVLSKSDKEIDMPVVMLVNEISASASEVLTISLKENVGAKVVGATTYGKGTVQRLQNLSDGSSIKYTIQKWLSPNGNSIDKVGIVPDFEVKLDDKYFENPTDDNDNQLQKAIEVLIKR